MWSWLPHSLKRGCLGLGVVALGIFSLLPSNQGGVEAFDSSTMDVQTAGQKYQELRPYAFQSKLNQEQRQNSARVLEVTRYNGELHQVMDFLRENLGKPGASVASVMEHMGEPDFMLKSKEEVRQLLAGEILPECTYRLTPFPFSPKSNASRLRVCNFCWL
jgi:hypothetical protein